MVIQCSPTLFIDSCDCWISSQVFLCSSRFFGLFEWTFKLSFGYINYFPDTNGPKCASSSYPSSSYPSINFAFSRIFLVIKFIKGMNNVNFFYTLQLPFINLNSLKSFSWYLRHYLRSFLLYLRIGMGKL
jgi:hypothetical protein